MNQVATIEPPALRPYQLAGLNEVTQHFDRGARRVIFTIPTGGGKTFCAATQVAAAVQRGRRTVIMAHRAELLTQFSETLDRLGVDHGFIKAGQDHARPAATVQVASIQTLVQRLRRGVQIPADLLVVDECHRALAATYKEVLGFYPQAQVLGLTATPWRLDNQGLGDIFDKMVVAATPKDLVADGYLVEPTVYVPKRRLDLSNIKVSCGDYRESDLDSLLNNATVCGNIVQHWFKHAAGLPTIAFAVNVAHSERIAEQFVAAGVAAEHVHGDTSALDREAAFNRLRTRKTTVLVNVDICTEGFDYPALGCVILARPTKSAVRFLQSVGRVMRPAPGKDQAICLDHAGSFLEHGFPSDPRDFDLAGTKPAEPPPRCPCPDCGALNAKSAGRCEACGWVEPPIQSAAVNEGAERSGPANDDAEQLTLLRPEERRSCPNCGGYQVRIIQSGKLGAFTYGVQCHGRRCPPRVQWVRDTHRAQQAPEDVRVQEWHRLKRKCLANGWAIRWAIKQYQDLFGTPPDWI